LDYRIEQLRHQLREDPSSRVFYQLGELLRRSGEVGESVGVLRSGLEHHPRYVAAWVSLGRSLLQLEDWSGAEVAFARALEYDPENAVAARMIGEAATGRGDLVRAVKALKLARALSPRDPSLDERIAAVEALLEEQGLLELARPKAPPAVGLHHLVAAPPEAAEPETAPAAAAQEEMAEPEPPTAPIHPGVELQTQPLAVVEPEPEEPTPAPAGAPSMAPAEAAPAAAAEPEPVAAALPEPEPFAEPEPPLAAAEELEVVAPKLGEPTPAPAGAPFMAPAEAAAVEVEEGAPTPAAVPEEEPQEEPEPTFPEPEELQVAPSGPEEPTPPAAEAQFTAPSEVAATVVWPEPEPFVEPEPAEIGPVGGGSLAPAPVAPFEPEIPEQPGAPLAAEPEPVGPIPRAPVFPDEEPFAFPATPSRPLFLGSTDEDPFAVAPQGDTGVFVLGEDVFGAAEPEPSLFVEEVAAEPPFEAAAVPPTEAAEEEPAVAGTSPAVMPLRPPSQTTGFLVEPEELPEEPESEGAAELPEPTLTLARLALAQGDRELAEGSLVTLLEREPDNAEAARLLGALRSEKAEAPGAGFDPARRVAALQGWLERFRLAAERLQA